MLKRGSAPHLECSTRGYRAFSAFVARVDGRSIEETYQSAKVFADGTTGLGWRAAKGRRAVNAEEVASLYESLWETYISSRPFLQRKLVAATGLSDIFGKEGSVCQADVLWKIRQRLIETAS